MESIKLNKDPDSPFHVGEQQIQAHLEKREQMEKFGQQVIRSFMPDQHREFFKQLPFIIVGSVDEKGWPWASIVTGEPGFASSPDSTTLEILGNVVNDDPLESALKPGASLGLLGIDMATRRRNRLNGRIDKVKKDGFSVNVDQSFGNCPQYIQRRSLVVDEQLKQHPQAREITHLSTLDTATRTLINMADTFFVSSFVEAGQHPEKQGVDVSHRGGRPGFVKVEGDTLTIPDYSGNYHFNTLGNFLCNPKAGLIFTDFDNGNLLMLTGHVEILWEDEPEVMAFKGAERAWRFTLDHGLFLKQALPFRSTFQDYSPNTLITGDWLEAAAILAAEDKRNAWRNFCVTRIEDESSVIRSFYLKPTDGDGLLTFNAGQFLTIRVRCGAEEKPVIRTYTVSSAPGDDGYRLSVKREVDGKVSNHLHRQLKQGDIIEAKAPSGNFYIDPLESRPAVLIAGGVGITPMISMTQHIVNEGERTRHTRSITVIHAAKSINERAFANTFRDLQDQTDNTIRYYSFISRPDNHQKPDPADTIHGRITDLSLRRILALDDYDFYLCGPGSFMQAMYDTLRSLGVADGRIFAESFGPASMVRETDTDSSDDALDEADQAIIKFSDSQFEQRWNKGDATLLEIAESHGLNPDFGCRNGVCGTCLTKVTSGSISYRTKPSMPHKADEALICCAVPASGTDTLTLAL